VASGSRKVIYAALIGNLLISITKFAAASLTRSSAMLSEGIHSLVDTGNQVLLLYGLRRAAKPPDEQFPFGHGKELYFWSFIVAILIFAVGAGVSIYEGVLHLLHPEPIESPGINYVVLALAMVFEGVAWFLAWREFNRSRGTRSYLRAVREGKDPTLFVVLFEDSAAMLGLIVAFLGVLLTQLTGILWFDGLASVLIGCILAGTAIWLAHETKGLLIGEAARPEVIEAVRTMALEHPRIDHVNEVLTLHMGPDYILVSVGVEFDDAATADDIEHIIAELDRGLKARFPRVKRVFIEAEKASLAPPG
jgi:cation diffusion facilitator family transporter